MSNIGSLNGASKPLSAFPQPIMGGERRRSASTAGRWLFLATVVLFAASLAALIIDYRLAQWSVHGYCPASFRKLCELTEPFGHGIGVLMIALLVFQLDPLRRWSVPRLLLISLGAGVAADLVKLLVARVRPRHFDLNAAQWSDFSGWLPLLGSNHATQSFPSGHTAVAVGLAFGLSWLYPRGRWLFFCPGGIGFVPEARRGGPLSERSALRGSLG